MKHLKLALMIVGILFLQACQQSFIDSADSIDSILSIKEAQLIYNEATTYQQTKTANHESCFNLSGYNLLWEDATSIISDKVFQVIIPIEQYKHTILKVHDGQGYYLSVCKPKIVVAKSATTEKTGVFVYYYIPLRNDTCIDTFSHKQARRYIELWTTLDGTVLEFGKRFDDGYVHYSVNNGDIDRNIIIYRLSSYIKGYISAVQAGTKSVAETFSCPRCGLPLSHIEIGYVCWSCGWTEYADIDGGELDPSIIVGDRDNSINNGLGEDLWGDDSIPDGSDGNSNNPGGSSGGCNHDYSTAERDSTLNKFSYNNDAEAIIKPTLEMLWNDCYGRTIINNICDMGISFARENTFQMALYLPQTNRIAYNLNLPIDELLLIEELFHALQKKNGLYNNVGLSNINSEIEAKMVAYIYAKHNQLEDHFYGINSNDYDQYFGGYLNDPSESNYSGMIDLLRQHEHSKAQFPDRIGYHIMENITALNSCLEYSSLTEHLFPSSN